MKKKTVRCAIYTRKSSDEGLEQDFNSLDAQREACAAYIESQKGEGWQMLSIAIFAVSMTVVVFYLTRQPWDRNYGGSTSGFRWVFWMAPLWITALTPVADRLSTSKAGSCFYLFY